MSNKKNLGIFLLSSVLTLSAAPSAFSQTSPEKSSKPAATQKNSTEPSYPGEHRDTGSKTDHMQKGSIARQDEIKKAQQALKDKGVYNGDIDGKMNPQFEAALRDYQTQNQLTASGKLDRATMAKLGLGKAKANDSGAKTGTGTKSPKAPERQKPNPDMTEQEKPADTTPNVNQAPATKPAESSHSDQPLDPVAPNTQKPGSVNSGAKTGTDMGTASSVEDVRQVQMTLKNRGYDPGEINGMLNSDTQEALKKFQAANNLPVTGILDDRTQAALGVTLKNKPKPDHQIRNDQSSNSWNYQSDEELSAQASKKPAGVNVHRAKTSFLPQKATPQKDRTLDSTTTDKSKIDKDKPKSESEYHDRVSKSTDVLQALTGAEDKRIPNELLQRAEAIVVIPNMIKGAFGIGGRYGKGLVSRRLSNGRWSPPSFVSIGGGSYGAQLGVTSTDLVLVFTDKGAVDTIEKGTSLKLGVDAGLVAGPIGRTGEAGVSHDLKSGIYAYSRSKGLFAGVALDGAVIDIDQDANHKVYSSTADTKTIWSTTTAPANADIRAFVEALDRVAPRKTSAQ